MANENPFDAALRAQVFDRSFLNGKAAGNRSGESRQGEVPSTPRSPDFAPEFEAALVRILNGNIAGLRPPPEKLPPEQRSGAPSAPAAAEKPKAFSLTGALRRLPPATWPIDLETGKVSSRAPPPKPVSAPRSIAVTSARDGSPAASPELQAGTRVAPAGEVPKTPDHAAEALAILGDHEAADSFAVDWFDDDEIAESERFDGLSAADLAKRYAPQMPAAASIRQAARSMPEPHAAHPIRWRSSDETPPGSLLPPPRGINRTRKAAAVAVVLAGVIGGVATVVNLESLAAHPPAAGAAADPIPAGASEGEQSAAARTLSPGRTTAATRPLTKAVEVILVDDPGDGPAPAEGVPLPVSAKIIPLPHPISIGADLRPTRDAGDGGDASEVAALHGRVVSAAPPVDAAPGGVAIDDPLADPGDAWADGADISAAPPPRAPTPRPDYGGSPPEGALAYAPAADPPYRRAKAVASKGSDRPAAQASNPSAARVVSDVPWVNVRARADTRAPTVTVLLAGSIVTIVKCTSWCEVVVDGKRGFVLKSFLRATGADHRRDAGGSAFGNPYLKNSS